MIPDLLIVGAGPAGVSAALWARELDLSVVVLEGSPRVGGQLHSIHFHPRDWAAVAEGDGPAVAAAMARQLADHAIELHAEDAAVALEPPRGGAPALVRTMGGAEHRGRALLIATGLRRRRLEVPGERELEGRGVSTSATRDRAQLAGRDVLVVGGGDAAFENALILAAAGSRVVLAVRGAPRARAEFRARVAAEPRIELLGGTRVLAIVGDSAVRAVRLADDAGERERPFEGVVVKVGTVPNTEWCAGAVECDAEGFVVVDARLRTRAPGVWAAGDVTRPALPSLTVAVGHGAMALADVRTVLRAGAHPPAGRAGRD